MGMKGHEYADLVASYILKNFGARGLTVYREVSMGKTIIGKNRHVDILVIHHATSAVLAIECKYQDTLGTVDEKIPYAIQDMQAMGLPVCLAYAGNGFSAGILHMLAACPIAAQCLPTPALDPARETRELDIALAMAFRFWDLVVANKRPFVLPVVEAPALAAEARAEAQADARADARAQARTEARAEALAAGPLFANSREPEGRVD
jgi:hypothetical protein